mmetsp:Transcript_9052/g.13514  ORF Transcript_9052/g.13514 Transcript_9052/m.13514 type:complete len:157 (+) Transcript_9052:153-623(+)
MEKKPNDAWKRYLNKKATVEKVSLLQSACIWSEAFHFCFKISPSKGIAQLISSPIQSNKQIEFPYKKIKQRYRNVISKLKLQKSKEMLNGCEVHLAKEIYPDSTMFVCMKGKSWLLVATFEEGDFNESKMVSNVQQLVGAILRDKCWLFHITHDFM